MRYQILVVVISFLALASCKDEKKPAEEKMTAENAIELPVSVVDDTAQIRTVIFEFYNWYNTNYEKFQNYNLYSGLKKPDAPPYKINWDEVKKYQDFIRSSVPQIGEDFLTDQMTFFRQCDSAFKIDVNDEIPYGFDYDWYTNSQEDPQYLLDEMNKKKNKWEIAVNGNISTVKVHDDQNREYDLIGLRLKKEKDKWVIVKIGNE